MTTTLSTASSRTVPGSSTARRSGLWKAGATAALVGSVAAEAVAGIARAVGVPMQAGGFGAGHADAIGFGSFAMAAVINLIIGTLLAAALLRWARHPERTFVRTALTLTAVSFVPVLLASHTAASTKVTLALTHLVVAAVAIPMLRRVVAARIEA